MLIHIDPTTTVNGLRDGSVIITRLSIMGKVASHTIKSKYTALEIAAWMANRRYGKAPLIQEAFPEMNKDDREFLISGITPEAWAAMFPKEDDHDDVPAGESA